MSPESETITLPGALELRPITDADMPFLLQLYATTRLDELAQVPWTDEQKAAFVVQQFQAQCTAWAGSYPDATFDLVLCEGAPIGRLYVDRRPEDIRIVDIALLPDVRGSGIGTRLIQGVFAEADRCGKKVSIHVEIFNRARSLYERLGFVQAAERGVYILMERAPRTPS